MLALDIDVAELLPPDDSGYGFDNIGDVLTVSPGLLERYLLAAGKISRQAVGDTTMPATYQTYEIPHGLKQDDRMSDDLAARLARRHLDPAPLSRSTANTRFRWPCNGAGPMTCWVQGGSASSI